jgi:hypothetical protein
MPTPDDFAALFPWLQAPPGTGYVIDNNFWRWWVDMSSMYRQYSMVPAEGRGHWGPREWPE